MNRKGGLLGELTATRLRQQDEIKVQRESRIYMHSFNLSSMFLRTLYRDPDFERKRKTSDLVDVILKLGEVHKKWHDKTIIRLEKLRKDNGNNEELPHFVQAAVSKEVAVILCDLWEKHGDRVLSSEFQHLPDFLAFFADNLAKKTPTEVERPQFIENRQIDRMLALHRANQKIERGVNHMVDHMMEAHKQISTLPKEQAKVTCDYFHRLVFGNQEDVDRSKLTEDTLNKVVLIKVNDTLETLNSHLDPESLLNSRDQNIMFKNLLNNISSDAESILTHESSSMFSWLRALNVKDRKVLQNATTKPAFLRWVDEKLDDRIHALYLRHGTKKVQNQNQEDESVDFAIQESGEKQKKSENQSKTKKAQGSNLL